MVTMSSVGRTPAPTAESAEQNSTTGTYRLPTILIPPHARMKKAAASSKAWELLPDRAEASFLVDCKVFSR